MTDKEALSKAFNEAVAQFGAERLAKALASFTRQSPALAEPEPDAVKAAWLAGFTEGEKAALAEQPAEQEPVAWSWVDLQNRADEIVRGKSLWKRFIDGTPLSNDIACWMADFAKEVQAPKTAKRVPLTDRDIWELWTTAHKDGPYLGHIERYTRAVERAHGITGVSE